MPSVDTVACGGTIAGWRRICSAAMTAEACAACFDDEAYFREVYALTAARLASVEDTTRPVTLAGCGPALDSLLELTGLAAAFERTD